MAFTARFPGICAADDCDERIEVGQNATYVAGDLFHADCTDTEPRPRTPRVEHPVCRRCYLVHPPQMECHSW